MSTTYFLGAGASAADGLPVTSGLDFGIANFLTEVSGLETSLGQYYRHAFLVSPEDCRDDGKLWKEFIASGKQFERPSKLPYIVESLSLLDVCIAENRGLGPYKIPKTRTPVELNTSVLREARSELINAIRFSIVESVKRVTRDLQNTSGLIARLRAGDTIVTTNWDYLLEKKLSMQQRKADGRWLKRRNVDLGCINARVTDWRGKDLRSAVKSPVPILKLHGGVNWYLCDRCQNLYVNVEYMPSSHAELVGDDGGCHCGARLSELIVAPSYLKDYQNGHLRSVWIAAQQALQRSRHWVFIGYSLPSDDFHIRALLLRALCVRRSSTRGKRTRITVVTDGEKCDRPVLDLRSRYQNFFRDPELDVFTGGFAKFLRDTRTQN
jgi:hypothetical protein